MKGVPDIMANITEEQLKTDLQFLLDAEFETQTGMVGYMQDNDVVEQELSLLFISRYQNPEEFDDYQFLLTRYITPDGTRGFGEVCVHGTDPLMTMRVIDLIDNVIELLKEQGRERVAFVAAGLRDGSLIEDAPVTS